MPPRAPARLIDPHDQQPLLHGEPARAAAAGVLPGTGGLTRVTDKRKVRRDLADVFCTTSEGVRADRAKQWKLVDQHREAAGVQGCSERTGLSAHRAQHTRGRQRRDPQPAQAHDRRRRLPLRQRGRGDRPESTHRDRHGLRAAERDSFRHRCNPRCGRCVVAARDGARARRCRPDAAHE